MVDKLDQINYVFQLYPRFDSYATRNRFMHFDSHFLSSLALLEIGFLYNLFLGMQVLKTNPGVIVWFISLSAFVEKPRPHMSMTVAEKL